MPKNILDRLPDSPQENCNGLTINEWAAAAGFPRDKVGPELVIAWRKGVDPTEYRAALINKCSYDNSKMTFESIYDDSIY